MSLQTMPGRNWTGVFSWKAEVFTDHTNSRQKWRGTWNSKWADLSEFNEANTLK